MRSEIYVGFFSVIEFLLTAVRKRFIRLLSELGKVFLILTNRNEQRYTGRAAMLFSSKFKLITKSCVSYLKQAFACWF